MDIAPMEQAHYVTFDTHVHIMHPERLRMGWGWLKQHYPADSLGVTPAPESFLQEIYDYRLQGFFNFFFPVFPRTTREVNEWNDRFCLDVPCALPFFSLHRKDSPEERREFCHEFLIERCFAGLKVHSHVQGIGLNADWLAEMCDVLEKNRRILYLHTGYSHAFPRATCEEIMAEDLDSLLELFPDLIVVAAHMLYPRLDLAATLARSYPNLYFDLAGMINSFHYGDWFHEHCSLNEIVQFCETHADRVMFGSDASLVKETIGESIKYFEELPLSNIALRKIGGENAMRIVSSLSLFETRKAYVQSALRV